MAVARLVVQGKIAPYLIRIEHTINYVSSSGSHGGNHGGKPKDSTMGKLMEKAGGMLKNEKMVEKGEQKREQAGYGQGGSNY